MSAIQEVYRTSAPRPSPARRWLGIGALTLAVVIALRWGLWNAVFFATTPDTCRMADGACWAVVTSQWKLALLGTYPYEAIWRPLVATVILIAVFLVPLAWPRLSVLAGSWTVGLMVSIGLLDGRAFGLPLVETREWGGLPLTLLLSEAIMLLAFPIALAVALARRSGSVLLRSLALVAVECIRGVPLVSLLFFTTLVMPLFISGLSNLDTLTAAAIAIVLFNAAYISEVFRGGLMTVPRGQVEAARSLGFRWIGIHWLIVLPQAFKACAPSLINQAVGIVKDTSLIAVLGLFDLMHTARLTIVDVRWNEYFIEVYILIGLAYFLMCTAVAFLGRRLSSRLDVPVLAKRAGAPVALRAETTAGGTASQKATMT